SVYRNTSTSRTKRKPHPPRSPAPPTRSSAGDSKSSRSVGSLPPRSNFYSLCALSSSLLHYSRRQAASPNHKLVPSNVGFLPSAQPMNPHRSSLLQPRDRR